MTRFPRLALLLLAFFSTMSAADLPQILKKMDEAALSFKGLTADMNRELFTYFTKEHEAQSGTVVVRRPKPKDFEVLFEIKEPERQLVSLTGRTGLLYNPKTNTVQEWNLGKYSAAINQYLLLGFGSSSKDVQESYTIVGSSPAVIGGQQTTCIELTPRKPDTALHLVRAELWISDETGIAVQQKVTYSSQNYDLVTYKNMKLRADIPESAVKMNLPKGVKREVMR